MAELEEGIISLKKGLSNIIISLIADYSEENIKGVEVKIKLINKTIGELFKSIKLNNNKGGKSFTALNALLNELDPLIKNIIKHINNELLLGNYINQLSFLYKKLGKL